MKRFIIAVVMVVLWISAGAWGDTIDNQGSLIDANGTTLVYSGKTILNDSGTLQASNGGTLQLGGGHWSGGPTYVTGGIIQALNGSTVLLDYTNPGDYDSPCTITGSTFNTTGSGVIQASEYAVLNGITNHGTIEVVAIPGVYGGSVVVLENTINNTGAITMAGQSITVSGTASLIGGGTVNLGGGNISQGALTNVDNTIQGSGSLSNFVTLNNAGLIDSNQSGGTISVSGAVTNSGTMRATNGGTLLFSGGSYTGAGGTVQASAGSTVTFQSAAIGGITTFSGPVTAYYSTLQNLNMSGNLVTRGGTTIRDTFTNAGQLDVYNDVTVLYSASAPLTFNGAGTTWFHDGIRVSGDSEDPTHPPVTNNSTLRGSFTLDLGYGDFINNGTFYAASADTILVTGGYGSWGDAYTTNNGTFRVDAGGTMAIGKLSNHDESTQTLTGGTYSVAGTLKLADEWAPASVVNNAANIIMDGPSASMLAWFKYNGQTSDALAGFNNNMAAGSFTLQNAANFTSAAGFSNAGAINIGAGSTFQVGPTGSPGTYIQTSGTTKLNGKLTAASVTITSGTISGGGTLNANLLMSGTLSPGNSPGTFTINGNYTQDATGELAIEAAMGSADFLDVHGDVALGGTLNVLAYGNWTGSVNDHFLILDWTGSKTGNFAQINLPALNGYVFSTEWQGNDLYLNVTGNGSQAPEPATAIFLVIGATLLIGRSKLQRTR